MTRGVPRPQAATPPGLWAQCNLTGGPVAKVQRPGSSNLTIGGQPAPLLPVMTEGQPHQNRIRRIVLLTEILWPYNLETLIAADDRIKREAHVRCSSSVQYSVSLMDVPLFLFEIKRIGP